MKTMLTFITLTSLLFMQASHPIALMTAILVQTLLCCLVLVTLAPSSWFSFILFLIFLGGLMVLFIYISSLAANEKFSLKLQKLTGPVVAMLLLAGIGLHWVNAQHMSLVFSNEIKMLTTMYSVSILTPTIMTMMYLLLTMIVVVKMTSKYEGPLRNMIYT